MIGSSVQHEHIVKAALVTCVEEVMAKTLFSLVSFDIVITQVLNVAVLLLRVVPFKDVPVRLSHLCASF